MAHSRNRSATAQLNYFRFCVFRDYLETEDLENRIRAGMSKVSDDYFLSLETGRNGREHYQGWVQLDAPYDNRSMRVAKAQLREVLPFKSMIKFCNGVWYLKDFDPEKWESYKRYVAKEKLLWIHSPNVCSKEMMQYHLDYFKVKQEQKATTTKIKKDQTIVLTKLCESLLRDFKHLTREDIIEIVVNQNTAQSIVLDTQQLYWIVRQLYAKHPSTKKSYCQCEVEILKGMFDKAEVGFI